MSKKGYHGSFRQSMTWLHTWFGLVLCWVMYFMFVTGTLGYFDTEIDRWMKPEVPVSEAVSIEESLGIAQSHLEKVGQGATTWYIGPAAERGSDNIYVGWEFPHAEDEEHDHEDDHYHVHAQTGEVIDDDIRETGGGQLLYRMHYNLHYIDKGFAYKLVGIITLIMFVGMITGIVVHKKIFQDLFTFRSHKRSRTWLDLHNLMSVASLPFQIMITYSGLIFMVTVFFPLIGYGSFGFDKPTIKEELPKLFERERVKPLGEPATMTSFSEIGKQLDQEYTPQGIRYFQVLAPGDANARFIAYAYKGVADRAGETWVFNGVTGELIEKKSPSHNAASTVSSTFMGLHEGLFAGPLVRWLYFVAGIMGCIMIASGAIYWVRKRQGQADNQKIGPGFDLVNGLNIGTFIGLLSAIAAYFLANRLLPLGMENRMEWEAHTMFLVWLVLLIHPFLRKNKQQAWFEQCTLASVLFLFIPVINALTTELHLYNSLGNTDWVVAGFDLTAIFTGCLLGFAALKMRQKSVNTELQTKPVAAEV